MSFLSILKPILSTIEKGAVAAEPTVISVLKMIPQTAPVAGLVDSGFHLAIGGMVKAEAASPNGGGPLKEDMVVGLFEDGVSLTQSVLATRGEMLTYDDAKLRAYLKLQAPALQAFADFKDSYKIVPIPK